MSELNTQVQNNCTQEKRENKIILFNKKFDYEANADEDDYIDHEVDDVVKDYDADEDENYEINEVIVDNPSQTFGKRLSSRKLNKEEANNKQSLSTSSLPNQSDSSSSRSSESGFGTVDDDVESGKNINENKSNQASNADISIQINECQTLQAQKSVDSTSSTHPLAESTNKNSQTLQMSFPILQPPRQIVYELNMNQSDDVVNILNDNSSLNSSLSSNSSGLGGCCASLLEKLIEFYYSCFCCYSTSPHNHTPMLCSWLTIFCCCCPFLGGISLYLNHRSKRYKLKEKYDLADKYSNYAEKLNIAALIFGVIFYAIAFFIITLVLFMYWRHHHS